MERLFQLVNRAWNGSSNCPIPCADGEAVWCRTLAKPVRWRFPLFGAATAPTDKCPAVLGGCGGWAGCATPPCHCSFSPTTWRRTRNEVVTTGCPAACCAHRRWRPRHSRLLLECPWSVTKYPWLSVHSGTSVDLCHRLRSSASTVLTATGQVNGRWRILTPNRIETHELTATKFRTIDYVRERTP